jgi:hypothetical protein
VLAGSACAFNLAESSVTLTIQWGIDGYGHHGMAYLRLLVGFDPRGMLAATAQQRRYQHG